MGGGQAGASLVLLKGLMGLYRENGKMETTIMGLYRV